jgi:uncharacterized protein YceH (UPF0502 family)
MNLDPRSLRVLGSLMEKEMTTPENYPLSLNALIAASNQRSSREPVMDLDEEQVRQSVHVLTDLGFVTASRDARVPKYEHRARTVLNLRRDETAVVCLLLLRGPQTPGEIRSRSDRMFAFDDLASVVATLDRLASREDPLTVLLPRQPGSREARYAHLLGGPVSFEQPAHAARTPANEAGLREEIASLHNRIDDLERRLLALESRHASNP